MDLGILQETKITYGVYTCGSEWYSVVATDAPIRHLRHQDVHVEIPCHHQFRAWRLSSYFRYHRLHGHFVLGGDVCPDYVPESPPRRHLENHHIRPTPLHRLHHEVGCGAVKKCNAAAVSARRLRRE